MEKTQHTKLNQFYATAICGNDILSSALYVSGIAILFAGIYAPIVLAIIAFVLFLYKFVYTEVVLALPINGGAYNCLLNGTSKTVAAIAGVMTILSYVATAVISGKVAIEYLHEIISVIPIVPFTILLLLGFAILVIGGIKDSAKIALGIFGFHIFCLISFLVLGLLFCFTGGSHLIENFDKTSSVFNLQGGIYLALFLGFSASLLGVSGFESSANFVEEQKKGVFRKTLRNMLIGVAIFNPLITLVVLNALPMDVITANKDNVLAVAAQTIGGEGYKFMIVIDAFMVLSGAVLTAFVGVSGLMYRMASDNCLPFALTKKNNKGSFYVIIMLFFLLCTSILLATGGNTISLEGFYTIAFLSVMSLFAIGNLILKESRSELKRPYTTSRVIVVLAFLSTAVGIIGNIKIDPNNLLYFAIYFIPAMTIVFCIIYQDGLLKFLLSSTRNIKPIHKILTTKFKNLTSGTFVAFIHHPDKLFQILEYINRNETGWNIILIHCNNDGSKNYDQSFKELQMLVTYLQKAGGFSHFNIECIYKNKPFNEEMIEEVSQEYHIDNNKMMIGSIHESHPFNYDDLGGVRIIF